VLQFITNARGEGRREQLQTSFRKKLSITPQCELASELDIYARRLSKDIVYDISEDVDEQDMEVGSVKGADWVQGRLDVFLCNCWSS
jgi:cystic fibrosis transmembrane conductance regulator